MAKRQFEISEQEIGMLKQAADRTKNADERIRRLIYITNAVEGYNRQLRKVTKTKSMFSTLEAVHKLLYLANRNVTKKWTAPIPKWANLLNQLAICFERRFPI